MYDTAHPQSRETGFLSANSGLERLPLDILCHETVIRDRIARLQASGLPIGELIHRLQEEELLPLVTGSRLKGDFRLQLEVSDDMRRLDIFRIDRPVPPEELNGNPVIASSDRELLVSVPNPTLLFSAHDIYKYATSDLAREMATQLFTLGRRITTYRGVSVTWDQAVDYKVWTKNIDTVNFINAMFLDGAFNRRDVKCFKEVGVGGAGISKTAAVKFPCLEELIATDISTYALVCAKRNILPVAGDRLRLNFFLGKGIKTIEAAADLIAVNPPYIPHRQRHDAVDPYRGTGLIEEIVRIGMSRLNPHNPLACIYLGMSNLADRDFERYMDNSSGLKVRQIGERLQVPLKILEVNQKKDWIDFLIKEHGLIDAPHLMEKTGFRYWHQIYVLKLERA